ncbi:succinylglutamate desuccinylase/aspartoacylase family protein [Aliiglaciecola sp.]|nr:succinylglutamate desuccinylase/aspartoacylase family protein [Aliiglaciecola sp.]
MSSIKLNHIFNPTDAVIGESYYHFLLSIGTATVIHLDGEDATRCRVFVTLLHGNEPSGLKATYAFLKSRKKPKTNVKLILASVVAASTEPVFTFRMLPGKKDLNRCFNEPGAECKTKDLQHGLAAAIKEEIVKSQPEAVFDIHNTSGSGPSFSVSVQESDEHIALVSHFTRRLIITDMRLGSLMEQELGCPVVTIEAGGAQDDLADETALRGLISAATSNNIFDPVEDVELLRQPKRLILKEKCTINYAESPSNDSHVTVRQDVEKLNFGITEAGFELGWINKGDLSQLNIDSSSEGVDAFFKLQNNILKTSCPLKFFMVTTRADIAKSDCLFYFVPA